MKENNWLYHYQFKYGLIKACSGISSRLSFSNELKNGLYVFEDHEKKITSTFREYMKDAELHFAAIRAELNNLV